jgi:hypothetical protein
MEEIRAKVLDDYLPLGENREISWKVVQNTFCLISKVTYFLNFAAQFESSY